MEGFTLKLDAKKKKTQSASVKSAFGRDGASKPTGGDGVIGEQKEDLVIPAGENRLKFRVKKEDEDAARALEKTGSGPSKHAQQGPDRVIQAAKDTFQNEAQQYKEELEALPDGPSTDEGYDRVPIGDFGAAMLRGMGWRGEDGTKKDDDATEMPRPHRLGLGATPKLELPTHSKFKRPDQLKRDEAVKRQRVEYAQKREKQVALDKQRTMQNGSLVELRSGKRAEIVQLVGVPGLNMVKVLCEGEPDYSIVKRGEIDGLLSRQELEKRPFSQSKRPVPDDEPKVSVSMKKEKVEDMDGHKSKERRGEKRRKGESAPAESSSQSQNRHKSNKTDSSIRSQWIVNNIRVRIITEKFGRRFFKEKGVVVDVTLKGATVELSTGKVLDRINERYLETALPKPGGNVIILAGKCKYAKGRLLERDSKKGKGVIQLYEDMNVLTLSLDDLAEWCGHLDDDLE